MKLIKRIINKIRSLFARKKKSFIIHGCDTVCFDKHAARCPYYEATISVDDPEIGGKIGACIAHYHINIIHDISSFTEITPSEQYNGMEEVWALITSYVNLELARIKEGISTPLWKG